MIKAFNNFADIEAQFKAIDSDLSHARRTILSLVSPPDLRKVVDTYKECKTFEDVEKWRDDVSTKVLEFADVNEKGRAACPLCGSSGSNVQGWGYKFKEGLWNHLANYGKVNECSILRHIYALARERIESKVDVDALAKAMSE